MTDPAVDRELIDRIEKKHRSSGEEVFFVLKHKDVGFKKRDIERKTYVDLIVQEAKDEVMKAEKLQTKEAIYKRLMLTLQMKYRVGMDT